MADQFVRKLSVPVPHYERLLIAVNGLFAGLSPGSSEGDNDTKFFSKKKRMDSKL